MFLDGLKKSPKSNTEGDQVVENKHGDGYI